MALLLLDLITFNLSITSLLNFISLSKNAYSIVSSYNIKSKSSCINHIKNLDLYNKLNSIDDLINKIDINNCLISSSVLSINEITDSIKSILNLLSNNDLTNFHLIDNLNHILDQRVQHLIQLLTINPCLINTNNISENCL